MTAVSRLTANDEVKIEERSDEQTFKLVVHTKNFKEEHIATEVKDHTVRYQLIKVSHLDYYKHLDLQLTLVSNDLLTYYSYSSKLHVKGPKKLTQKLPRSLRTSTCSLKMSMKRVWGKRSLTERAKFRSSVSLRRLSKVCLELCLLVRLVALEMY